MQSRDGNPGPSLVAEFLPLEHARWLGLIAFVLNHSTEQHHFPEMATDETSPHGHCSTEEEEAPSRGSPKRPLYKEKCFEKLRETRATIPNDIN